MLNFKSNYERKYCEVFEVQREILKKTSKTISALSEKISRV